jgi:hypothetical protein
MLKIFDFFNISKKYVEWLDILFWAEQYAHTLAFTSTVYPVLSAT